MASLPPEAAGAGDARSTAAVVETAGAREPQAVPLAAATTQFQAPARPVAGVGPRTLPPVQPSNAPVELSLDLRATPPDKVLSRLLGALDRVSEDVTLLVLLRDTP